MKVSKNNVIDVVILLIYGMNDLSKMGFVEETIDGSRADDKEEKVISPVFRYISESGGDITIGYDYAYSIKKEKLDIDTDEQNKSWEIPDIKISINPKTHEIEWAYNNKTFYINFEKLIFKMFCDCDPITIDSNFTKIDKQAVPSGEIAIDSYANNQIIVSQLESGNQFVFHNGTNSFDMINCEKKIMERQYIIR